MAEGEWQLPVVICKQIRFTLDVWYSGIQRISNVCLLFAINWKCSNFMLRTKVESY